MMMIMIKKRKKKKVTDLDSLHPTQPLGQRRNNKNQFFSTRKKAKNETKESMIIDQSKTDSRVKGGQHRILSLLRQSQEHQNASP